jgi:quercetin dioxygenase-like cupin family protein
MDVVDVEALDWQGVPDTWPGRAAYGEPGVKFKMFATGATAVPSGQLIEFEPDHHEAAHSHPESELFYILSGDLTIGDAVISPGMVIHIEGGTKYGPLTTEHGCRFLRLSLA